MGEEIALENGRISDFRGLGDVYKRQTAHHCASLIDLYSHAKFH